MSEAQCQQLQATVEDVTSASALESRVLLQKIAQLNQEQAQLGGSEQKIEAMRADNESLSRALSSATQEVAVLKEKAAAAAQQAQQLKHVKQQVTALAGDWQVEVSIRQTEILALREQLQKEKELTERLQEAHQRQEVQQQQQLLRLQHCSEALARVDELERQVPAIFTK
jgi:chromosome segregation ATPase